MREKCPSRITTNWQQVWDDLNFGSALYYYMLFNPVGNVPNLNPINSNERAGGRSRAQLYRGLILFRVIKRLSLFQRRKL